MAGENAPVTTLGALLKLGKASARETDPQAPTDDATRVTYLGKRPMFCGRKYTTQLGDRVVCTRDVERLPNGLPTGRCASCREEDMRLVDMRRAESKRLELAERNAKRLDGAKRRTGLKLVEDE